jgi:hypothetical protein
VGSEMCIRDRYKVGIYGVPIVLNTFLRIPIQDVITSQKSKKFDYTTLLLIVEEYIKTYQSTVNDVEASVVAYEKKAFEDSQEEELIQKETKKSSIITPY